MRALWAAGTKAYDGARVSLPETTCYPRPVGHDPRDRGRDRERAPCGSRPRSATRPTSPRRGRQLDEHVATLRRHSDTVRITVLDLPTIGTRPRGRLGAGRAAPRPDRGRGVRRAHACGTAADQRDRWGGLAELGVDTVFLGVADLEGPEDVERLGRCLTAT